MKPVRRLALALTFAGLGASAVFAQNGAGPGYPSTGRYNTPALLPLPQASGVWVPSDKTSTPTTAQRDNGYVAPAANYVPSQPVAASAPRFPTSRTAVPTMANPYYPAMSYNTMQEPVPAATPATTIPPPPPGDVVPSTTTVVPGPGGPAGPPHTVMPGMSEPGMVGPNVYDQAAANGCWNGDCGCCDVAPSCDTWYGYLGGLAMTRDNPSRVWTTFETGNNANQLMFFPSGNWGGGVEVTLGHAVGGGGGGCGCGDSCGGCDSCSGGCGSCGGGRHAVEITYWGIFDLEDEDSIRSETDSLSTPIDVGFVDIPTAGLPATVFFDNAREHRVRRENEFHNVELNLVDLSMPVSYHGMQYRWLVGARFFRFDEFLQFASVSGGNEFGSAGGANEAYLDMDVENNLYGLQLGGRADRRFGRCGRVFAGTKVGVFANDIDFDVRLYRGDGATATFASTGNAFDLTASETDVSMLAQIDVGLSWDFSQHWSATVGYRAVGITGLALADEQVPAFLAAEQDWLDIDSNSSMILHGAFAGLEFHY